MSCLHEHGEIRRRDMHTFTRKIVVLWLLLACLCGSVLTGCNTMEGAGQDIEQAGEGIQDAVD
jgi:predicted small secreted protein